MKSFAIKVINTVITFLFFIVAAPFLIPAAAITWVTMGNPFHLDADGAAAFFTMQILAVVIAIASAAFAIGYFI